jgi:hypothetical protein
MFVVSEDHVPYRVAVRFPCPVCRDPLNVKQSKKNKPYVVCPKCLLQMFVRGDEGIKAFNLLTDRQSGPKTLRSAPEAPLPRGRPRKDPEVAERVVQAVEAPARQSALKVLTGRTT